MSGSGNGRSRRQDLTTISLIIGIVLGLAGGAWSIVSWAQSVLPRTEAEQKHEVIHHRISEVDRKADNNERNVEVIQQTIGRDVKTIKCLLTAPNRKAKQNCGLGD